MRTVRVAALLTGAILALAGCGSDADTISAEDAPPTTPALSPTTASPDVSEESGAAGTSSASGKPTVSAGTVVATGDSEFGEMLFDDNEQAIYLFEPESDGVPACYDECAAAWPPVLTDGQPQSDGNVDAELLGTVEREDGTTQVTYNGWPLYFYAHEGPGQVLCHNIVLNGGLWLAVGPDGDALPG